MSGVSGLVKHWQKRILDFYLRPLSTYPVIYIWTGGSLYKHSPLLFKKWAAHICLMIFFFTFYFFLPPNKKRRLFDFKCFGLTKKFSKKGFILKPSLSADKLILPNHLQKKHQIPKSTRKVFFCPKSTTYINKISFNFLLCVPPR